jgi:hypothetical protein
MTDNNEYLDVDEIPDDATVLQCGGVIDTDGTELGTVDPDDLRSDFDLDGGESGK